MDRSRSDEEKRMLETAARTLPGGVLGSSWFPDDLAFVVRRGAGSKLYDVSGREYIDYLMGSGPLILGHAHPAVVAAVRAQLEHGTTYFLVNEPIVALADELCRGCRAPSRCASRRPEPRRPSSRSERRAPTGSATKS